MNKEAAKRVAAGAGWLDKTVPGWEHKLSFQELNLAETCHCVLGQVFFEEAAKDQVFRWSNVLGEAAPSGFMWAYMRYLDHDLSSVGLGFDHDDSVSYDELTEAWLALVKNRFDTGTLSG